MRFIVAILTLFVFITPATAWEKTYNFSPRDWSAVGSCDASSVAVCSPEGEDGTEGRGGDTDGDAGDGEGEGDKH